MSNDTELISIPRLKLIAIFFLTWVGSTAKMMGDFSREVAALIVIFAPLELWDKPALVAHGTLIRYTAEWTLASLFTGIALEYLSAFSYRIKKDLEGHRGDR